MSTIELGRSLGEARRVGAGVGKIVVGESDCKKTLGKSSCVPDGVWDGSIEGLGVDKEPLDGVSSSLSSIDAVGASVSSAGSNVVSPATCWLGLAVGLSVPSARSASVGLEDGKVSKAPPDKVSSFEGLKLGKELELKVGTRLGAPVSSTSAAALSCRLLGLCDSLMEGSTDGEIDGISLKESMGVSGRSGTVWTRLGDLESVGSELGAKLMDGFDVRVGCNDGTIEGAPEGSSVGDPDGSVLGEPVGLRDGASEGVDDGIGVGSEVTIVCWPASPSLP